MDSRTAEPPDNQKAAWTIFAHKLLEARSVWTVSDGNGLIAAKGVDGSAAQPFWSSRDRAEEMIAMVGSGETAKYFAVEIPLDEFVATSLPELARAGVLVGVDWAADQNGWVFDAAEALTQLREIIHQRLN